MRANENTIIVDNDVVLVPYRSEHVAKYHGWMTSPELRELTASEPLTLREEYEMQSERPCAAVILKPCLIRSAEKWQVDGDKLTFIVLAGDGTPSEAEVTLETLRALPMIGDVNLFLKGAPGAEDFEAEVEVMIAVFQRIISAAAQTS
ncbi:hypothetical protein AcV5_003901 [Taiwanofungus camphoratus]|nr:hypothetical protein AcV5_003901 [Antrodia cinnamomea]